MTYCTSLISCQDSKKETHFHYTTMNKGDQMAIKTSAMSVFVKICVCLFALILVANCCFLTSCPYQRYGNGKRSQAALETCSTCGPNLSGFCFGPQLCCTGERCYIGQNDNTLLCHLEARNARPCMPPTNKCTVASGNGYCAMAALCCTESICEHSEECQ